MNKKIIYTMLIMLGVLLVLWVTLKNAGGPTSQPESLTALNIDLDTGKATKIDVFKQDFPDSGLHFARIDTMWVVTNAYNAPAKSTEVDKLLSDLAAVNGQIRAESADLYDNFDITDEKALQIEVFDKDSTKLLHAYIGKGSGGKETFMRLAGSPTVYLADENFISRFAAWNAPPEKKLPTNRWVDLTLCDLPRESIKTFTIKKGKSEYGFALIEEPTEDSLAPPVETWTQVEPEKGTKLEESKIKRLFTSLANLKASDVADPANKDKYGLDNSNYDVNIADNQGKTVHIEFGKSFGEKDDRYAAVDGKNAVYIVPNHGFEVIFEEPFKKPE